MRNVGVAARETVYVLVAALALFSAEANGDATRSAFGCDFSIQKSTHIVLASEGEKVDGVLQVVESWKGDLQAGDVIEVPELAQFASKESRTINHWPGDPERGVVSGDRMILFLVKSLDWADGETEKLKTKWLPASWPPYSPALPGGRRSDNLESMRISVAWVEGERTYAYSLEEVPGPQTLMDTGYKNVEAIRKLVEDRRDAQDSLRTINSEPDPAERVRQAIAFGKENPDRMDDVVEIVAGSGDAALPGLRQMLNDSSFARVHPSIIGHLGAVGGAAVGPDLTELLKRELAFWRESAPSLEKGWWNGMDAAPERRKILQDRYGVAIEALRTLENLGYGACKDTVTELRDCWASVPSMEKNGGSTQMQETCDQVLASLGGPRKGKIKYAWGLELAACEPDPARRAEALVPYLNGGHYANCERAFSALAECGVPALPILRSILRDDKRIREHYFALSTFARVGGIRVGGEITQLMTDELAYMARNDLVGTAQSWNELSADARFHYTRLATAVEALEWIVYPGAVNEVSAVFGYAKGLVPEKAVGLEEIVRVCESYLAKNS